MEQLWLSPGAGWDILHVGHSELSFSNSKQTSPFFPVRATPSSGSDQSQREEDFYYTKICCEAVDVGAAPAPPQQALGQAHSSCLSWASCASPPGPGLQIPPAHRPRSNSSSGPGVSRPSPLSQSAPSSFWQIHSEHLYQVGAPAHNMQLC